MANCYNDDLIYSGNVAHINNRQIDKTEHMHAHTHAHASRQAESYMENVLEMS